VAVVQGSFDTLETGGGLEGSEIDDVVVILMETDVNRCGLCTRAVRSFQHNRLQRGLTSNECPSKLQRLHIQSANLESDFIQVVSRVSLLLAFMP
jgi:hypothetical protein